MLKYQNIKYKDIHNVLDLTMINDFRSPSYKNI